MIYSIGSKLAVFTFWLAICGIVSGLISGIFVFAGNNHLGGVFVISSFIIILACILSFITLILSFFNKELFSKYFKRICITFVLTFAISAFIVGSVVYIFYNIFHEEPYNESNTSSIISNIENDFGFKFPKKMESLQTGETIARGIDPAYVCIVRFITDQNGLSELKQFGEWTDITEEINTGECRDPRMFTQHPPQWFKNNLEKGRIYCVDVSGEWWLGITCVEMPTKEVVVYMHGLYDFRHLSQDRISQIKKTVKLN
jgi:uncharacterized membrane protein (DUF485 family)